MTIAVIDYEMGNLRSVQKALERVGADAVITRDPDVIMGAGAAVLPGVGAFGACMENLRRHGLVEPVKIFAASGRPFLGICVGMQILFEESEEFGPVAGLGVLPGRIVRFRSRDVKIPHMGWNALHVVKHAPALDGIAEGTYVYFVHSYYAEPSDPAIVAATSTYGSETFTAAVARENVFATQFHPEKSQHAGLRLLGNFVRAASAPVRVAVPA